MFFCFDKTRYLSILFSLLSLDTLAIGQNCVDFKSVYWVNSISDLVSQHSLYDSEEMVEFKETEAKLFALDDSLNIFPIETEVTYKDSNTKFPSLEEETNSRDAKFSATIDITDLFSQHSNSINDIEYDKNMIYLRNFKKRLHFNSVLNLVELAANKRLKNIYTSRKSLLEKKAEYFQILNQLGDNVSEKLLDAEVSLLEMTSKIDALDIKRKEITRNILNFHIFDESLLPEFNNVLDNFNFNCEINDSVDVKIAKKNLQISTERLNKHDLGEFISIDYFFNYTKDFEESNSDLSKKYTNGIEIVMPIYDGGKSSSTRSNLLFEIKKNKLQIESEMKKADDMKENFLNLNNILKKTFSTQSNKLNGLISELDKLKERQQLGDSIFLEMSDKKIQISILEESMVGLVKDFIASYFKSIIPFSYSP